MESTVWAAGVVGDGDIGEDGPSRMDREVHTFIDHQYHATTEDPIAGKAGHDINHTVLLFSDADGDGDGIFLIINGEHGYDPSVGSL